MDSGDKIERNQYYKDDIDLFVLVDAVIDQRFLVALFCIGFMAVGYFYAMVSPKEWTAEASISWANPVEISRLNPPELDAFTQSTNFYPEDLDKDSRSLLKEKLGIVPDVNGEEIFQLFLNELLSVQTLLEFDDEYAGRVLGSQKPLSNEERIRAASHFVTNALKLKISELNKVSISADIGLTLSQPERLARVLNDYLVFVNEKIINDRRDDLRMGIERAIQKRVLEIERAKGFYLQLLEQDLAVLEEAFGIAAALGIKENESGIFINEIDNRLTEATDLYLLGERFLEAEIRARRLRMENSLFDIKSRALQLENQLLQSIKVDVSGASAYTVTKPAIQPKSPSSPDTRVIILFFLMLGGMLGVIVAIIRCLINRRHERVTPITATHE